MAMAVLLLFTAVFYTQHLVQHTAAQSRIQTQTQHRLSELLTRINTSFNAIEGAIYEYVLLQDNDLQREIDVRMAEATNNITLLNRYIAQSSYAGFDEDLGELHNLMGELYIVANKIKDVASSAETRYPAMSILTNEMYVSNRKATNAIEAALDEGRDLLGQPEQEEINRLLWQLRYFWAQQISHFRVFVANRSGVFGVPGESLQHNLTNIYLYFDQVKVLVDELREFEQRGLLGLQQSDSLEVIQIERASYVRSFEKAAEIYISENWRADLPLIRKQIQPLFDKIGRHVDYVASKTEALRGESMNRSLETSRQLSMFIWVLTGFVCALLVLVYVVFEKVVRRPLHRMSLAMMAESKGESSQGISAAAYHTIEIKRLFSAFTTMREQVNSRQKRLQSILDNAAEGIVTIDESGKIETFNNAAERLFGYEEASIIGRHVRCLVPLESWRRMLQSRKGMSDFSKLNLRSQEYEVYGRRCDGMLFPIAVKFSQLHLDGRLLVTAIVSDVSERKALFEKLRQMAEHDPLTGLYNRLYFTEELDRAVANGQRGTVNRAALVYIDLDNFKYVNDTLGHLAGDEVLVDVAHKLGQRLRKGDVLARLGGDEFAILMYDVPENHLHNVAENFRAQFKEFIFRKEGEAVSIGCSIGVAAFTTEIESREEFLTRADVACNVAKRAGRNRVHLYTADDNRNRVLLSTDMGWARQIKNAIQEERLVLVRQPIQDLQTGRRVAYEILLRMMTSEGELLEADGFLPAAERFGLSIEVDKWVIQQALQHIARTGNDSRDVFYNINLSADSITSEEVLDTILQGINKHGLRPSTLVFEITETAAIRNLSAAAQFLSRLREFGCRTAIDDFGSGYCSFAYLKELPSDFVKIDGTFVLGIVDSHLNETVVRAITEITHAMNQQAIAEFVEDAATLHRLQEIGVDMAQGMFVGKPAHWDDALPRNVASN